MKLKKLAINLVTGSALVATLGIGFMQAPASACLTPWTDDCDWISDDVLMEPGDINEAVLPITDIYVTNESDQTIYVSVMRREGYFCNNTDGCNGGDYKSLGTWTIRPNARDVFIVDNASTVDDENNEALYLFQAHSADGRMRWDSDPTNLNWTRRYTYTFGL